MASGCVSRTRVSLMLLVVFLGLFVVAQPALHAQDGDVPYVPTPDMVVDRMLEVADVGAGDYVIDLGSGDGRIVIEAARRGAAGYGIDIDPERVSEARLNAKNSKVDDRVVFKRGDIFEEDFSEASVVTMYLLPEVNRKLRPELLEQLEPGSRIVSHDYDLGDWEADRHMTVRDETLTGGHEIYYWVVPAQVDGGWTTAIDGQSLRLEINQSFQEVDVTFQNQRDTGFRVENSDVHGERVEIEASNGDVQYLMNGRVNGDEITGNVQVSRPENSGEVHNWKATRR